MKLDILAFGVHPDDVELSCAGVLLVEQKNGKTVGIVDLTRGELGTRGTAETRETEAAAAAMILGVAVRENLDMADGFFQNNEAHQRKIISVIRAYQPEIILCNAPEDRHPDHGRSSKLVADAAFLSGLKKIETERNGVAQEAWRPKYVFRYIQDRMLQPDFVIDISSVFEKKIEAIKAYKTQFHAQRPVDSEATDEPETYISKPDFLDSVIYRHKWFGKMIGVEYGEGYITEKTLGLKNFDSIIKENT
ncbi:MAG: bacillithiol biosynthesis deacetylase BshB1 [Chitinophagaceae bacterium]|nr:bacillithiol biosynthesis deacetylase BshB1 [Chitinophagaceae bacterium]